MYLIEYRFLEEEEPKSESGAIDLVREHLESVFCPEAFVRWREVKETGENE